MEVILEATDITKSFGGVRALKNANFTLKKGEVHSLVGENGAGKTTLTKIISGAIIDYSGELRINSNIVKFKNPLDAQNKKIAMIYQERSLILDLDGAQNIMMGIEPKTTMGFIDKKKLQTEARKFIDLVSKNIEINKPVRRMSAAKQQLIEIAKALSRDPDIIIMDEPTSSLTDNETHYLINAIKELKEKGKSIIFISHKLEDVFGVSDRVTVMRDGHIIDTHNINSVNKDVLIRQMIGRRIENLYGHKDSVLGEERLRIENLCRKNKFKNVSFVVRSGEILGISGLVGAGRSEVAMCIFGRDKLDSGEIYIDKKKVEINSPDQAIALGLALIPEDRKQQGLVQIMNIKDNLTLAALKSLTKAGYIKATKQKAIVDDYVQKLDIKTPNTLNKVSSLSGGNQQKVVIGKWLATKSSVLILDEPTRGIDIGTKAEIYKLIAQLSEQGMAIVFISSEMPEILGLCTRILVMREGELVADMPREEASEEKILKHYLGNN